MNTKTLIRNFLKELNSYKCTFSKGEPRITIYFERKSRLCSSTALIEDNRVVFQSFDKKSLYHWLPEIVNIYYWILEGNKNNCTELIIPFSIMQNQRFRDRLKKIMKNELTYLLDWGFEIREDGYYLQLKQFSEHLPFVLEWGKTLEKKVEELKGFSYEHLTAIPSKKLYDMIRFVYKGMEFSISLSLESTRVSIKNEKNETIYEINTVDDIDKCLTNYLEVIEQKQTLRNVMKANFLQLQMLIKMCYYFKKPDDDKINVLGETLMSFYNDQFDSVEEAALKLQKKYQRFFIDRIHGQNIYVLPFKNSYLVVISNTGFYLAYSKEEVLDYLTKMNEFMFNGNITKSIQKIK